MQWRTDSNRFRRAQGLGTKRPSLTDVGQPPIWLPANHASEFRELWHELGASEFHGRAAGTKRAAEAASPTLPQAVMPRRPTLSPCALVIWPEPMADGGQMRKKRGEGAYRR